MLQHPIDPDLIAAENARAHGDLDADYDALARSLARRGIDADAIKERVKALSIAIPSWGVGTGGTRFARFPIAGEPRSIWEKVEDCGVIQQLARCTPTVSPHFPWDVVDDFPALRDHAAEHGLAFDAVNSNTFQDPAGGLSYKFGSLSHADPAVRAQTVAHNLDCIGYGQTLGSSALTVWIADGANFPGQQDLGGAFDRYLESMHAIYAGLPDDWRLLIEHKLFEPAFYATVISDWGSSILAAMELGPRAQCLIDLGHHAPNVNIEQIVARLRRFGKLGGFHFNDSKYGDDDLDAGSINPFQLFLVFNELVTGATEGGPAPAYMMDQSHNVTDPIESLVASADSIAGAFARALLVDRAALAEAQACNDVLIGHRCLKRAYETDVAPITAMARLELGGAIDPIATYRRAGYRLRKANERPAASTAGAGIV